MTHVEFSFNDIDDLYQNLKTQVLAAGWTLVKDEILTNTKKLYFSNPQNDTVVFFDYEFNRGGDSQYVDRDAYILVNVASYYDDTKFIYNQPNQATEEASGTGSSEYKARFYVYDNIPSFAFLNVTENRILLITRQKNLYSPIYLGKYLAYASPAQEPYPFIVYGSSRYNNPYYNSESSSCGWTACSARFGSEIVVSSRGNYSGNGAVVSYPYSNFTTSSTNLMEDIYHIYNSKDKFLLHDIEMLYTNNDPLSNLGTLGSLEGVYAITSNNITSEAIFSINSNQYKTFVSIGSNQPCFALKI